MGAPLADCLRAHALSDKIHSSPDGVTGCCLHLVLDDGNVDDGFILSCRNDALHAGHSNCVECATIMKPAP